ncbi:MAG: DUF3786 domain-containing protein [Pseudomonadota bacterium]
MPLPKNAMEVFKELDKSNCQACGKKTCMAFAGAVYKREMEIGECPRLPEEVIRRFSGHGSSTQGIKTPQEEYQEHLAALRREVQAIDFQEAALRTGGTFADNRLTLKILGKDFSVDTQGKLYSDIHIIPWIVIPFFDYILYGKGVLPSGEWISYRNIKDGAQRYPLFQKRCEQAMKQVADTYTDLFDDIVQVLNGKQVEKQFQSDISVVMYPLPKVPIMICYWAPDEGLASTLNVFFDKTADSNLDSGALFNLGAGLAQMFGKLAQKHGHLINQ